MKSAVFYGENDVRIEDLPIPELGPDDVLVKVMACGVCGTDVHIFHGDKGSADCPPHTTLGHEFSGIVERVGAAVTNVKVGDRVCADPNQPCGECYYCRSGLNHFCENRLGYGTTVNGGFSQYARVHKQQVYSIGEDLSFLAGAAAEPVACCMHGVDLCGIQPGDTVMVIGGGMIGLITMQLVRLSGASTVIMMEPVARKRELARKLGADLCINPLEEDPEQVLREHGIFRIQCVIECVGMPSTIAQAIALAGKKSTVMMFGLTKPDEEVAIKPFYLFSNEITLKTSFINPYTTGRAVDLIRAGRLDVTSMVLEPISLKELPDVLADATLRREGKVIVDPWKE